MEPEQIIGISLFGVSGVILIMGLVITQINKNRNYNESDQSGSESSRDSDSSMFGSHTINNTSFSERDMASFRDSSISDRNREPDKEQFKDEDLTAYSEGVNLPMGGKRKKTRNKKTKSKKSKKNKKL